MVLWSHSHGDRNNPDPIKGKAGEVLVGDGEGSRRGKNSVYVFTVDGLKFCHIGDLGHDLTPSQVEAVGKIDMLFVLVGGFFTIGPEVA